jgi:hypothetical protein
MSLHRCPHARSFLGSPRTCADQERNKCQA